MRLIRPCPRRFAVALTVAAALAAGARGQDQPHPIAAQVKAAVKDPSKPFTLVVRLRARDGAGEKIEAAFAKVVKTVRREKGCLRYDLNRDAKEAARYLVYERWQSLDALETHLRSRHITALLKELGDLMAAPPEIQVMIPAGGG